MLDSEDMISLSCHADESLGLLELEIHQPQACLGASTLHSAARHAAAAKMEKTNRWSEESEEASLTEFNCAAASPAGGQAALVSLPWP